MSQKSEGRSQRSGSARASRVDRGASPRLPLLAALWMKAVVAPLEILQRKEFQLIAARQRAGTWQTKEGK